MPAYSISCLHLLVSSKIMYLEMFDWPGTENVFVSYANSVYICTQLETKEQELNVWRRKLAELHAQYDWLLFLSVPKVLKIYALLRQRKPSAFQITSEISFLFSNDPTAMEVVQNVVEVMS